MNKTLRISFSLKKIYRVNSILCSLKQIPLIKKLLPDMLYQAQALFMNCDHSLLTYPFYKQPKRILKLFQIRLREIVKLRSINHIYSLYEPVFSVHYLTIYYLFQPYNAETELKSGTYKVITSLIYLPRRPLSFVCRNMGYWVFGRPLHTFFSIEYTIPLVI